MQLSADKAVIVELAGRLCLSNVRALAAAATAGTDGKSGWVNLAMTGRWEGHPSGAFEFTPAVFSQIIANFKKNKTPVKFDYEHQSMNGQPGAKPASGHIKDLEMRDSGATLWGLVDWTPKAAEMIKAGEYRFCSPVVAFKSIDRKSGQEHGAELLQAALTDDPFLDGQQPIQLSFTAAGPMIPDEKLPPQQVAAPMSAPPVPPAQPALPFGDPPVPPPSADANLQPADGGAAAMAGQPPTPPAAPPAEPPAPADAGQADGNALVDLLAQASGSDRARVIGDITDNIDQFVAILQKAMATDGTAAEETRKMSKTPEEAAEKERRLAALEAGQKDATIVALSKQVELLAAAVQKVTASDEARATREVEKQVDQLIADGYVEQVKRAEAIWAFSADPVKAKAIFATKVVPIATSQSAVTTPEVTADTRKLAVAPKPGERVDVRALSRQDQINIGALTHVYKDEQKAARVYLTRQAEKGAN